ncbi:sensor histidine kinase [Fibrella aquatilis]|uniref:Histidine kinase n=1 Tax=Fibrella aquatilis TaxID=2817059 RepID=A0A939G3M8_9BACT|nr:histidine kinase [Fibrella aquatilis]MBO0929391.1 histidine kinase [Fibrella aquatilis]
MKWSSRPDTSLIIAHLLLWGLFLLPPVPYYLERMSVGGTVLAVGFGWVYFGLPVYANGLYFLPRFFFTGKRLTYLLLTLVVLLPYAWAGTWLFKFVTLEKPPLIFLIARFYTLAFAFGFIDQYVHRQKTHNRLLQLESQQNRLELDRLKAQVNPHFLFNTLNNLYTLTLNQSPQAPDVVLGLANLMRYLFTTNHADRVLLTEEVAYLDQYIALERLRLSTERAVITFVVQGPVATVQLPPMLLIPFVENAFKHGVETDTGQVFVAVTLAVQDRDLFFEVENSKPAEPFFPDHLNLTGASPNTGTGLSNVRQRLALLYPNTYQLAIDDQPLTYKTTLAIQL